MIAGVLSPRALTIAIGATLATTTFVQRLYAHAGALDPTFGVNGIAFYEATGGTSCHSGLGAVAIHPDGSILATGWRFVSATENLAVLKLGSRGHVMSTYFEPFGSAAIEGRAVVVDSIGKIYVGANIASYAALFKLNADLTPDTSFGTSGTHGYVNISYGGGSPTRLNDLVMAYGDLYATGTSAVNGQLQIVLDRISTLATYEYAMVNPRFSIDDIATSVGVYDDFDGLHVMVGGYEGHQCFDLGYIPVYNSPTGNWLFAADSHAPGGNFNTVGVNTQSCYIDTMTMLPSDSQIAGGRAVNTDGSWSAYFQLLNSNGYTTNVTKLFKMTPWGDNSIRKILVQPDGRWLMAGFSGVDSSGMPGPWVGRFDPDGSVDTSFGTNGATLINFDPQDFAYGQTLSAALDHQGRVVLAGTQWTGASDAGGNDCTRMFVARLQSDDLILADGLDDPYAAVP